MCFSCVHHLGNMCEAEEGGKPANMRCIFNVFALNCDSVRLLHSMEVPALCLCYVWKCMKRAEKFLFQFSTLTHSVKASFVKIWKENYVGDKYLDLFILTFFWYTQQYILKLVHTMNKVIKLKDWLSSRVETSSWCKAWHLFWQRRRRLWVPEALVWLQSMSKTWQISQHFLKII